jgi:hypothetical protein
MPVADPLPEVGPLAAAPAKRSRWSGGVFVAVLLFGAVAWLSWILRFVPVGNVDVSASNAVAIWVWDRWQHELCLQVYQTTEGLRQVRRICASDF